jgi:hypothetical protein
MVTVLKAQVTGPLESYALEFAAKLLGQGYTASGASQHSGFIAHLTGCGKRGACIATPLLFHVLLFAVALVFLDSCEFRGYFITF